MSCANTSMPTESLFDAFAVTRSLHTLTRALTHSLTHPLTYSLTHARTHARSQSQCYAVAPSQIANPNLSRFFSYWNLPSIVAAIRNALQELGIELMYDVQPAGAAIRFKTYDKRGERLTGSFNIEYEATEDDYAAIAPEASIRDLAKQRKGALAVDENDEDVTIQPGGHHSPHHGSAVSDVALGRGVGQGGYVVKLYTKGDPLEKKRLFREVELRMPQGLIYAR